MVQHTATRPANTNSPLTDFQADFLDAKRELLADRDRVLGTHTSGAWSK